MRDEAKAAILVSLFLVFFFSYGHIFNLAGGITISGTDVGQHKYIFPALLATLFVLSLIVILIRRDLNPVGKFLNTATTLIVAINVVIVVYGLLVGPKAEEIATPLAQENVTGMEQGPDIYYVILDGCARSDILDDLYQFDATGFTESLTETGFFVADESLANYSQTYLSLASSLNISYLDSLVDQVGTDSENRSPLRQMIHDSLVVNSFRQRGYEFISFATGMDFTEIKSADRYIANRWALTEFHNTLLNTTPIPGLLNRLLSRSSNFQYDSHRQRILFTLENLGEIAKDDAPTFTFAHVLACHPPFVFGPNGETQDPEREYGLLDGNFFRGSREQYVEGYTAQLSFIHKKLEKAVATIMANSDRPPIIILQGDHGGGSMLDFNSLENTNLQERMSILNAYYLPDGGHDQLYHEITPVNTFRVVLGNYFGEDLSLLEDRSYYAPLGRPYDFTEVTSQVTQDAD
jgi:hypothetical protein